MAECHVCGRREDEDAVILRPVREVRDDQTGYQDVIYLCDECAQMTEAANETGPTAGHSRPR